MTMQDQQDDPSPNDLTYQAWVLLANVSEGDWSKQALEWQEAVVRWRDAYHAQLACDLNMPHDIRFDQSDVRHHPPNCPARGIS